MPLEDDPRVDFMVECIVTRLVVARERAGLTQRRLAQEMGLGVSVLSRMESSHRNPSLERVLAYILAVGADPAEIFRPFPDRAEVFGPG
jgi:transcriptional regulator with XRE-family HTH domain